MARRRSRTAWPVMNARRASGVFLPVPGHCDGALEQAPRGRSAFRSYQVIFRSDCSWTRPYPVSQIIWACCARAVSAGSAARVLRKTVSNIARCPDAGQLVTLVCWRGRWNRSSVTFPPGGRVQARRDRRRAQRAGRRGRRPGRSRGRPGRPARTGLQGQFQPRTAAPCIRCYGQGGRRQVPAARQEARM